MATTSILIVKGYREELVEALEKRGMKNSIRPILENPGAIIIHDNSYVFWKSVEDAEETVKKLQEITGERHLIQTITVGEALQLWPQ